MGPKSGSGQGLGASPRVQRVFLRAVQGVVRARKRANGNEGWAEKDKGKREKNC